MIPPGLHATNIISRITINSSSKDTLLQLASLNCSFHSRSSWPFSNNYDFYDILSDGNLAFLCAKVVGGLYDDERSSLSKRNAARL